MQYVTAALSPILGVPPQQGRLFRREDDDPSAHVVIISDRLWRRRFGADPEIVNRPIQLDGRSTGRRRRDAARLFDPRQGRGRLACRSASTPRRGRHAALADASRRLRPGVTVAQAQDDMTRVHAELRGCSPLQHRLDGRRRRPSDQLTGDVRPALLRHARRRGIRAADRLRERGESAARAATARHRELAVRAALGAGRGATRPTTPRRESAALAVGGLAGLLLAWWATRRSADRRRETAADSAAGVGHRSNAGCLLFTLGATILSGAAFGLVPALTAARHDV